MNELKKQSASSGTEIIDGSGNVFADLGFHSQEAANLQVRARLMSCLIDYVEEEGLTQESAADRLGVHQPRVSMLMQGKISEFSVDALVNMLARVGVRLKIDFEREPA